MEPGQIALALAAGIPTLIAAIGYSMKKHADAKATHASADKDRSEARKLDAETARLNAETTGRFGKDALDRIAELETTCEELRDTVDKLRQQPAERDAAPGALTVELAKLHDSITSSTDPVFRRLVRAVERFRSALVASGWVPSVATERQTTELDAAMREAREVV